MIDRVMICGIRRANELIPRSDILQAIGRAGRSYTKDGNAVLLVNKFDESRAYDYLFGKLPDVKSQLHELSNIAFHVLPEIKNHIVKNKDDFNSWYSRSLSFIQGKKVSYNEVINYLIENDCVILDNENLICSEMGKISSNLFFEPYRLKILKDKIDSYKDIDDWKNEFFISWLMSYSHLKIGEIDEMAVGEYKSQCSKRNLYFEDGETLHGFIFYCIVTGTKAPWLKFPIHQEKTDIDRLILAIQQICDLNGYFDLSQYFETIKECINHGMPPKMIEFAKETDIWTKSKLFHIFSFGIENVNQISVKQGILKSELDETTVKKLSKFFNKKEE